MEDPNPVKNIDRLGDLMFQTSEMSTVNQCTSDYCLKSET
jgi:hypothetical protein